MYKSEVGLQLLHRRKFPRLFLLPTHSDLQPLSQVSLQWADKSTSSVLGLSYSGVIASSQGILSKMKVGQYCEARLRIKGQIIPLQLRVITIMAEAIGFLLDSISSDGRLKLDQSCKDGLVAENFLSHRTETLGPLLVPDEWWVGPFDTTILLWWGGKEVTLSKFIIEYDNVLMVYANGGFTYHKAQTVVEESRGYTSGFMEPFLQKVSVGTSWQDRWIRLLSQIRSQKREDWSSGLRALEGWFRANRPM